VITTAVESCDVLLALIGDRWLAVTDSDGQRRLDSPQDFVRLEIEAALTRNVRVIPILIEGARMPQAHELPEGLAKITRRQAQELSPNRFDIDTRRLLRVLDRTIAGAHEHDRHEAEAAARRRQAGQLQDQIRERVAARDWDAVVAASDELAALDPAAADPDGLASAAREEAGRQAREHLESLGYIRLAAIARRLGLAVPGTRRELIQLLLAQSGERRNAVEQELQGHAGPQVPKEAGPQVPEDLESLGYIRLAAIARRLGLAVPGTRRELIQLLLAHSGERQNAAEHELREHAKRQA
jgi:hypothetical protein